MERQEDRDKSLQPDTRVRILDNFLDKSNHGCYSHGSALVIVTRDDHGTNVVTLDPRNNPPLFGFRVTPDGALQTPSHPETTPVLSPDQILNQLRAHLSLGSDRAEMAIAALREIGTEIDQIFIAGGWSALSEFQLKSISEMLARVVADPDRVTQNVLNTIFRSHRNMQIPPETQDLIVAAFHGSELPALETAWHSHGLDFGPFTCGFVFLPSHGNRPPQITMYISSFDEKNPSREPEEFDLSPLSTVLEIDGKTIEGVHSNPTKIDFGPIPAQGVPRLRITRRDS